MIWFLHPMVSQLPSRLCNAAWLFDFIFVSLAIFYSSSLLQSGWVHLSNCAAMTICLYWFCADCSLLNLTHTLLSLKKASGPLVVRHIIAGTVNDNLNGNGVPSGHGRQTLAHVQLHPPPCSTDVFLPLRLSFFAGFLSPWMVPRGMLAKAGRQAVLARRLAALLRHMANHWAEELVASWEGMEEEIVASWDTLF